MCGLFGNKKLSEIAANDLEDFKLIRLREVKPATVNRSLLVLRHLLNLFKEIGDEDEIRGILNSLGVVCWNLGLYEEALSYYQEGLAICKNAGNTIGEGITLSGMGIVHLSLYKYEEALRCNKEALSILKATGDQKVEGYILNSIGNVYYKTNDYQMAWKYYQ